MRVFNITEKLSEFKYYFYEFKILNLEAFILM